MSKMSRDKGKVGERELAAYLTDHGFPARRGVQYKGGAGSPDVICEGLDNIHFECKRVERLDLWGALAQAEEEKGDGEIPVVAHRPNKRGWVAILPLSCLLDLIRGTTPS